MSLPTFSRIIWDGFNLDWPSNVGIKDYVRQPETNMRINRAMGSKVETIFHGSWEAIKPIGIVFGEDNRDFYNQFYTFWSHAEKGREFAFALDRDDAVDLLTTGAVVKTDTVIPMTDTTGIVVDQVYLIKSLITQDREIVTVQSINAGVDVTLYSPGLHFDFENGAVFRSQGYFPHLIAADKKFPAIEKKGQMFEVKIKVEEAPEL